MRYLFITLGFVCIGLATLGIFLPVLPTTPFLLLASWLFLKSNPALREWLIRHPLFGIYIKNYLEHHAIPLHAKIATISALWVTIGFSIYIVEKTWLRILLAIIAIGVTIHLLLFKTLKGGNSEENRGTADDDN